MSFYCRREKITRILQSTCKWPEIKFEEKNAQNAQFFGIYLKRICKLRNDIHYSLNAFYFEVFVSLSRNRMMIKWFWIMHCARIRLLNGSLKRSLNRVLLFPLQAFRIHCDFSNWGRLPADRMARFSDGFVSIHILQCRCSYFVKLIHALSSSASLYISLFSDFKALHRYDFVFKFFVCRCFEYN